VGSLKTTTVCFTYKTGTVSTNSTNAYYETNEKCNQFIKFHFKNHKHLIVYVNKQMCGVLWTPFVMNRVNCMSTIG